MQIITPAINNHNNMLTMFSELSPGIKIVPVVILLIAGMLLMNEDAVIVCGATKLSARSNGIKNASKEAVSRKNLFIR